jgi:hypothetical protein
MAARRQKQKYKTKVIKNAAAGKGYLASRELPAARGVLP